MLSIQHLTKVYSPANVKALDDVTFDVPRGQFLAVIGLSGSGKSTLLRCINRLIEPTAGQILWDGVDITAATPEEMRRIRRQIGMVFQHFELFPHLSVTENLTIAQIKVLGRTPDEAKTRGLKMLDRVGLSAHKDKFPGQLSGGQQQRVAIARAIVSRPAVLLADEPTGNLDSRTSVDIMALLQDLWRAGMTIVLVTHEADIASYASRVIVMRDGQIRSDRRQTPVEAVHPPDTDEDDVRAAGALS